MKNILAATGLLCAFSLTVSGALVAQTKPSAPAAQMSTVPAPKPLVGSIQGHESWPAPKNMADVDTIDHIVASLYDVISGPAGKARDWDRFRSLFLPDGRLAPIRPETAAAGTRPARKGDAFILTPDMYVERDDPFFKANGFFERSIANRVEEFGNLAHVWSTYESRHAESDATPFARGVNSIQLIHAQGRYWIASIMWDDERPGLTLPEKYLK
ncbi:MAG TPA: hypothetical protein VGN16_15855 [Acidobacteriaceae bacterium]|jgi:hypothetical protein